MLSAAIGVPRWIGGVTAKGTRASIAETHRRGRRDATTVVPRAGAPVVTVCRLPPLLPQVLSDDEKRAVYDLDGEEGLERHEKGENAPMDPFAQMFGGGGRGRQRGPDAQVDMEVTLEDLFNGAQRQARISRNVICPKCRGTGAKDGETIKCKACGGRGVRLVQRQMAPGFVVQMQEACGECGGRGNIPKAPCPHCSGKKVGGGLCSAAAAWGSCEGPATGRAAHALALPVPLTSATLHTTPHNRSSWKRRR